MISLDFLEKSNVFKGLNDDHLKAVQQCCQEKEFQRGEKIFGEGDDASCLCIVREGQVDLRFDLPGRPSSEKNTISSLTSGMTFQWSSLVTPHKTRLSSYCASRSCIVVMADRKQLTTLFEKDMRLGYLVMSNLAEIVGERFHTLQDEIANRRGHEVMFNW
jgi:CRP-like cAMP-binding protein